MKKKILTAAVACCLLFTLVACSSNPASTASSINATTSASTADAATLERYDYVADTLSRQLPAAPPSALS